MAVGAELLGTFALAHVVLNVATTHANIHNSHFGLSIGFTVFAMAVVFGNVSGAAFNPAVGTGLTLINYDNSNQMWVYWCGPLVGGALAALLFRLTHNAHHSQRR